MALTPNLQDREQDKFVESPTRPNKTAIEVQSINGALSNVAFDSFDYQYPSATQEIIRLFYGGLSGTLKATITLNYTNSAKDNLLNGTVVKP